MNKKLINNKNIVRIIQHNGYWFYNLNSWGWLMTYEKTQNDLIASLMKDLKGKDNLFIDDENNMIRA